MHGTAVRPARNTGDTCLVAAYAASLNGSLSANVGLVAIFHPKEPGMNRSQTVGSFLTAEVQRRYWVRWNDDNKDAIDAYNARIEQQGLPLARYRGFWRGAL